MNGPEPIPLSDVPAGELARVHHADVHQSVARLLLALGLTSTAEFRLCKAGEPCIIQVRSTRIGLARDIARRILVTRVTRKES